jgi:cation:H+ antiporter
MLVSVGAVLFGLLLLLKGADIFVTKAEVIGHRHKLSPILTGILVLAIGTSMPELVVSILASLQGHSGLALSNIIGSNIANIGLIIGITALIGEITLRKKTVDIDIPMSIVPLGVVVFGYLLNIQLAVFIGVGMLMLFVGYLLIVSQEYRSKPLKEEQHLIQHAGKSTISIWCMLFISLAMLLWGGELTITYLSKIAAGYGISELFIGGVILSLGTSFPELITTVTAALKGKQGLALGNVLGSNVFNMLVALGASAIISPIVLDDFLLEIIALGVISFAFVVVSKTGKRYSVSWNEGLVLLSLYVIYVVVMILTRGTV